jgi:hypothetical protein
MAQKIGSGGKNTRQQETEAEGHGSSPRYRIRETNKITVSFPDEAIQIRNRQETSFTVTPQSRRERNQERNDHGRSAQVPDMKPES